MKSSPWVMLQFPERKSASGKMEHITWAGRADVVATFVSHNMDLVAQALQQSAIADGQEGSGPLIWLKK